MYYNQERTSSMSDRYAFGLRFFAILVVEVA
jgi:hypothetical protein